MAQTLSIIKNGEDISGKGIRASEEILSEELLDINIQLLSNIIILGQGLPFRFTNNTPSGRKEVLEKLFKADFMIDDIKYRISNRLSDLKDEMRSIEDSVLSIQSKISIIKESYQENNEKLNSLEDISSLKSDVEKKTSEIKELLKELDSIKLENELIIDSNQAINDKIIELTEAQVDINNSDYLLSEIESIKEEGTNLKNTIIILDKEIQQKDSISDTCPTCGQKLIGVKKPDTSEDKKKSTKLKLELDSLREKFKSLQSKRQEKLESEINSINIQINELKIKLKSIKNTNEIENKISVARDECSKITSELNNYTNKKKELEENIIKYKTQLDELDNQLNVLMIDKIKLESRLDISNKINTIIKRDFRGYLLSNVISLLDVKVKEYALNIFNHNNINISQSGNSISITLNDKEYEQLSGGEKSKLDICLQLALRDVLTTYTGIYSNILAIDEIFDGLDEIGSEKILNLISTKLNIPSVYIVTHRKDFDMPMDNRIVVIKNNKGSVAIQH